MFLRTAFFLLPCLLLRAFAQGEQEADVKAAFIYNFTRYVEWNSDAEDSRFVICVLGESPVTTALEEIARKNTIKNKRIVVRQLNSLSDIGKSHILFIPGKSPFSLASILDRTGKGVLTISEEPGYASRGTAFNFIIKNEKLKFEANLKALDQAGLKASSQLLKLAIIVE